MLIPKALEQLAADAQDLANQATHRLTANLPKNMPIAKIVSAAKSFATLFVPNPNGYKFVKSADGDKTNLISLNLVWVPGPKSDAKKYMPARGG